jgi:hypothetical protein
VYQLSPKAEGGKRNESVSQNQRGRLLFGQRITFTELEDRFDRGATLKVARLSDYYSFDDFLAQYNDGVLPLFVVTDEGEMIPFTADSTPSLRSGHSVIVVVDGDSAAVEASEQASNSTA